MDFQINLQNSLFMPTYTKLLNCILSNSLNSILTLYLEVTLLENASIIKRLELNFLFFRKFSSPASGLLFAQRFRIESRENIFKPD